MYTIQHNTINPVFLYLMQLNMFTDDQTEIEPKKKRTGRSTAARYGSMVPTKKDKGEK